MAEKPRPTFVMVAGPNGAGKSTAAPGLIRDGWAIARFINADVIARGLAAYDPALAAVPAGKVMLGEMKRLIDQRESFAVETTLSSKMYARWLREDLRDYRTHLAMVYLKDAETAVARVGARVASGGHDIPESDIRRRYERSFTNFFSLYRSLVDTWEVFDNSGEDLRPIARQDEGKGIEVFDGLEWSKLRTRYD